MQNEISLRECYQKALEKSKLNAEKSTEAKSIFLANMSHEIRTPLSLILGFAEELINSSELTPSNRYLIHTIQSNSEMLARLINDILDFSKIEAGKMDFNVGLIKTCPFIDELENLFKTKCSEKSLTFRKEILTWLPQYFYSDEVRIKQILMNLVCNSLKYTDKGGVILKLSYNQTNSLLHFDVIDTGEGIPLNLQSNVFQMFKQLHKDKPGSGLGLSLSRNLARGLEGDLKLVLSKPGGGTWFRAEIKNQMTFQRSQLVPSACSSTVSHSPPDMTGWKVLIVDDLIDNIRLLECILRPTKAILDSTTSSKKALQKVQACKYDLVLLDLIMPEMNGFKTLEKLSELHFSGQIWAVSAHAMTKDIKRCLEAGFSQHISKPIQRADFYQKLQCLVTSQKLM